MLQQHPARRIDQQDPGNAALRGFVTRSEISLQEYERVGRTNTAISHEDNLDYAMRKLDELEERH